MGGVVRDAKKKYENKLCYGKIGAGFTYLHSANVGRTPENDRANLHREILLGLATMNEAKGKSDIKAGRGTVVNALTKYGGYSDNETDHAHVIVSTGLNKINEFTGYSLKEKRLEIVGLDINGNCREVFMDNLSTDQYVESTTDDGM